MKDPAEHDRLEPTPKRLRHRTMDWLREPRAGHVAALAVVVAGAVMLAIHIATRDA